VSDSATGKWPTRIDLVLACVLILLALANVVAHGPFCVLVFVLVVLALILTARSLDKSGVRGFATALVALLLVASAMGLLVLPAYLSVEDARVRQVFSEDLKKLAWAMHSYHDKHRALPPHAVFDRQGRPLLSWRVLLLPYLGQEDLYKQFKLDEPWDSSRNRLLLEKMPAVYLHPLRAARGEPFTTNCQVFVGKGAAFEGERGLRIPRDFPDGTSQTILIVEAARAVPWTKPEDLPYAPDWPLPRLGGFFRGDGFYVACADGSPRYLLQETSEATLRALITRNGRDKPGADWSW
jgi:hypothetical protein